MKSNEMNKVLFHNLTCLTISIAAFLLLTSNAYAYRSLRRMYARHTYR